MPQPLERHFTVTEIAELWKLSYSVVRRIFVNEEGVLRLGDGTHYTGREKSGKKHGRYFTLRVPESVLQRVQNRLMNKGPAPRGVPRLLERSRRNLQAG